MGNFNRDNRDNRERRDGRGGRDTRNVEMHEVICSDCGKNCKVPFKPTNQKPVYCSKCFENHGEKNRNVERFSRGDNKFQGRRESNVRDENVNTSKNENQYKDQIDKLIAKMDVIINILSSKKEVEKTFKKPEKKAMKEKSKKRTVKK
jgi:CxxC-x17-CxxC domain-containing protein